MSTIGEELPRIMAKVRDEILPIYVEVGPAGAFAAMMIRAELDQAARAMATGDLVAMIRAYETLKANKL